MNHPNFGSAQIGIVVGTAEGFVQHNGLKRAGFAGGRQSNQLDLIHKLKLAPGGVQATYPHAPEIHHIPRHERSRSDRMDFLAHLFQLIVHRLEFKIGLHHPHPDIAVHRLHLTVPSHQKRNQALQFRKCNVDFHELIFVDPIPTQHKIMYVDVLKLIASLHHKLVFIHEVAERDAALSMTHRQHTIFTAMPIHADVVFQRFQGNRCRLFHFLEPTLAELFELRFEFVSVMI